MTNKVTFIEVIAGEELQTNAIIENPDGSFTSMTKAHYEAQQAEQSTPIATDESAQK
jgi:hypothetical protein